MGARPFRMTTASLCETCVHTKVVVSSSGSRFLLCCLSKKDPNFVKYPLQPLMSCTGYEEGPQARIPDREKRSRERGENP